MKLGSTHILEAQHAGWPDAAEAAKQLGISRRTFDRMHSLGKIDRYRGKDGKYRYNPEDISRLSEDLQADEDEVLAAIADSPTAALLSQAYAHNHFMMTTMRDMTAAMVAMQGEHTKLLTERNQRLEDSRDEMIAAREKAMSEAHERELAAKQLDSENARKDKALKGLLELAPVAMATRGASKFMSSISPMQLQMALGLGTEFWTAEQLDILKKMAAAKPVTITDNPESEPQQKEQDDNV